MPFSRSPIPIDVLDNLGRKPGEPAGKGSHDALSAHVSECQLSGCSPKSLLGAPFAPPVQAFTALR